MAFSQGLGCCFLNTPSFSAFSELNDGDKPSQNSPMCLRRFSLNISTLICSYTKTYTGKNHTIVVP